MSDAEILTIGDELLSGETVDTNSAYLDLELARRGYIVRRHVTVADELDAIARAFTEAAARAPLVLSSGGLGPTQDDLTLEAFARALGCGLRLDLATLDSIRAKFARFGREMTPNNQRQAMVPERGEVIENGAGTAPAFTAELAGARVFLLPGVPREVRWLMERAIGPRIDRGQPAILRRTLKVMGLGESRLEHTIRAVIDAHPAVRFGFRALGAENHVKLAALDAGALAAAERAVAEVLGPALFGAEDVDLAARVLELLEERKETVAVAESCTGGMVAARLTEIPGASRAFVGGVVAYANAVKVAALGVDPEALAAHGAVSGPVAEQMAKGVREALAATWGVSITGIAGPDGGSAAKPVGLVHLGIAGPDGVESKELNLPGDRGQVRASAAALALDLLRRRLSAR